MRTHLRAVIVALFLPVLAGAAFAQTDTSFTYQGYLEESGHPANGAYTMTFSAWDALFGGSQHGSTQTKTNVPVVDGRFTVVLDFGGTAMQGDRWLQIAVGGTPLTPRQPVTGTPYALRMRGMFTNSSGSFVGVGRSTRVSGLEAFGVEASTGTSTNYGGMYVSTPSADAKPFYGYAAGGDSVTWTYLDGDTDKWHLYHHSICMTVDKNGHVGMGTTNPSARLHVEVPGSVGSAIRGLGKGAAYAGVEGYNTSSSGSGVGVYGNSYSSSGYDFYAAGAGINYGSASSRRWKQNVEPIADPLEKLGRLRGVSFDWDQEHGGHHDVGMIAEEVGEVLPEIVSYEENGVDAVGMDYSKLTPLLVEAVNALRDQHDAELEALREENRELRRRVEALEEAAGIEVHADAGG